MYKEVALGQAVKDLEYCLATLAVRPEFAVATVEHLSELAQLAAVAWAVVAPADRDNSLVQNDTNVVLILASEALEHKVCTHWHDF